MGSWKRPWRLNGRALADWSVNRPQNRSASPPARSKCWRWSRNFRKPSSIWPPASGRSAPSALIRKQCLGIRIAINTSTYYFFASIYLILLKETASVWIMYLFCCSKKLFSCLQTPFLEVRNMLKPPPSPIKGALLEGESLSEWFCPLEDPSECSSFSLPFAELAISYMDETSDASGSQCFDVNQFSHDNLSHITNNRGKQIVINNFKPWMLE